jgi:hypothetical protein
VKKELFKKFGVNKRALTRDFRIQNDHNGFGIGVHPAGLYTLHSVVDT